MPDIHSVRHSEYEAEASYWAKAWDVYRGGQHVVTPSGLRVSPFFLDPDAMAAGATAVADEERPSSSRTLFKRSAQASYLHSHLRETYEEYQERVAKAVHIPLFRSIVDVYVAAVLRTDAERVGQNPFWKTYWSDMDLAGTQSDTFFRQALTYALVYKKAFAVTDRAAGGRQAVSRGDQLAMGERSYTYLIPPQDLVDYRLDRFGKFVYAVIREDMPSSRMPGEEPEASQSQYRVWYTNRWELYRKAVDAQNAEWIVVEGGRHPVGEVPVAPVFARRGHESRRTLAADGILADVLDMDLNVFNLMSLFHDQIYAQVFAQLVMPTDSHGISDVELGARRVLLYDPESGSPQYIQPNHSLLLALWQIIMDEISITRQMASTSRGRAEYSREERSAAALQAESGDKHNAMASLVDCVETFDRAVHRHAAAWEGLDNPPRANYSRDVSLKALSAQIDDATKISALSIPGKALVEVYKPLMARMLREHGQGEDSIKRAYSALDEIGEQMEQITRQTLSAPQGDPEEGEPAVASA